MEQPTKPRKIICLCTPLILCAAGILMYNYMTIKIQRRYTAERHGPNKFTSRVITKGAQDLLQREEYTKGTESAVRQKFRFEENYGMKRTTTLQKHYAKLQKTVSKEKYIISKNTSLEEDFVSNEKTAFKERNAIKQKFILRSNHLKRACFNSPTPLATYKVHRFYSAKEYNLTHCSVHKVGSSAMLKVFFILNMKGKTLEVIRNECKRFFSQLQSPWPRVPAFMRTTPLGSSRTQSVIITRNPFHRLFSGYMDRVYILSECGSNDRIPKCPDQTGFDSFLAGIMMELKTTPSTINGHFAPINWQCVPCEMNAELLIIEMENFEEELDVLLKNVGVTSDVFTAAHEVFDFETFGANVHHSVEKRFTFFLNMRKKCVTSLEFGRRFWIKLQTEGLLGKEKKFPQHVFNETYQLTPKTVADIVKQEIRQNPLTKSQAMRQRLGAIQKAYSTIPYQIIEQIKHFYLADFKLFNYDITTHDRRGLNRGPSFL